MVTCAVTNPWMTHRTNQRGIICRLATRPSPLGARNPRKARLNYTLIRGALTLFTPIVATTKSGLTKLDTLPTQAEDSRDKLWVNDQAKNKRADERWAAHTCTDTGRRESSSPAHAVACFGHPHGTNYPCATAALCR